MKDLAIIEKVSDLGCIYALQCGIFYLILMSVIQVYFRSDRRQRLVVFYPNTYFVVHCQFGRILTIERLIPPIQGVEDLVKSKDVEYGTFKGGSTEAFFEVTYLV